MTPVRLFWAAPTGRAAIELRRYEAGACAARPEWGSHWSAVRIGGTACERRPSEREGSWTDGYPTWTFEHAGVKPPRDDARWPTTCLCGYTFTAAASDFLDRWPLYAGSPDGVERRDHDLPVGAVYRVEHYEFMARTGDANRSERIGPDGMCIEVVTPWKADGSGRIEWCVDRKSANGGFWDRNAIPTDLKPGDPVPLHCNPSIFQNANGTPPGFHGWLHNGELRSA